jgi:hypothetical protein
LYHSFTKEDYHDYSPLLQLQSDSEDYTCAPTSDVDAPLPADDRYCHLFIVLHACRACALHFLQEGTQLVLFFLGERGHELHDAVDALRQDPLKEIKRCFGEFNASEHKREQSSYCFVPPSAPVRPGEGSPDDGMGLAIMSRRLTRV